MIRPFGRCKNWFFYPFNFLNITCKLCPRPVMMSKELSTWRSLHILPSGCQFLGLHMMKMYLLRSSALHQLWPTIRQSVALATICPNLKIFVLSLCPTVPILTNWEYITSLAAFHILGNQILNTSRSDESLHTQYIIWITNWCIFEGLYFSALLSIEHWRLITELHL